MAYAICYPGGVHSDFLGEFSGYIALSMGFIFYAVVFGIILEVLRRHKDRRAAGQGENDHALCNSQANDR